MKLETVIKTLQVYHKRYLDKHGVEPHVCPSMVGELGLCKSVGEKANGDVRYTGPFEHIESKSLVKMAAMVKEVK